MQTASENTGPVSKAGVINIVLIAQNSLAYAEVIQNDPWHEAHQSCSKIELICDPLPSLHALRNVMLVKDELLE